MTLIRWSILIVALLVSAPDAASAAPKKKQKRAARPPAAAPAAAAAPVAQAAPAGALSGGGQEALEVRGQTRALSMMLVLRSKKDKVDFVKLRTNYRPEILGTEY
jgi:3-oxoacyl-ACP reductase-like protein